MTHHNASVPGHAMEPPAYGRHVEPSGPWLQLASGSVFPLTGPMRPVSIGDVAASLAKTCRFAGACRTFYSVAQHSVIVSQVIQTLGGSTEQQMWGLLHDAAEFALGDIPRPTKRLLGAQIKALEGDILRRIISGLGLSLDEPGPLVWVADEIALATERRDFMVPSPFTWELTAEPMESNILPMSWPHARDAFIMRFESLSCTLDSEGVST